ncbi:IS3 family transposase [Streptomyces anulatus]|uniref:Transposase n=1 Tax=Streptomyces filamentosus NRRL 15998 TaxID=457431 RepID=D6AVE3_STRFL|nr:transposase [Streptomyces filamentosus NRRL 15998]ESU51800.1 integrase catalytic region [Streptomyces sp. HCCB10043]
MHPLRDAELKRHISEAFESNYHALWARKIERELSWQGHDVALCTAKRLMRELGIAGAVRGQRVVTTLPGRQAERPRTSSTATSWPAPRTGAGWRLHPREDLGGCRLRRLCRGHLLPPDRLLVRGHPQETVFEQLKDAIVRLLAEGLTDAALARRPGAPLGTEGRLQAG